MQMKLIMFSTCCNPVKASGVIWTWLNKQTCLVWSSLRGRTPPPSTSSSSLTSNECQVKSKLLALFVLQSTYLSISDAKKLGLLAFLDMPKLPYITFFLAKKQEAENEKFFFVNYSSTVESKSYFGRIIRYIG